MHSEKQKYFVPSTNIKTSLAPTNRVERQMFVDEMFLHVNFLVSSVRAKLAGELGWFSALVAKMLLQTTCDSVASAASGTKKRRPGYFGNFCEHDREKKI